MDTLTNVVDAQAVLVIGAIAVALLSALLLIKILRASAGLILSIGAIVLVLQSVFGISPRQLWAEIGHLPQVVSQFVSSLNLHA